MKKKDKSMFEKVFDIFKNILLLVGIVTAFYKIPGIIAEKISYWKLKNKKINQEFDQED